MLNLPFFLCFLNKKVIKYYAKLNSFTLICQ